MINDLRTLRELAYSRFSTSIGSPEPFPDLSQLQELRSIVIQGVPFTGSFPGYFPSITRVEVELTLMDSFPAPLFPQLSLLVWKSNADFQIPATIPKDCALQGLHISNSSVKGNLPESLANCELLVALDISYNFMGPLLPQSILTLPNLGRLNAESNNFSVVEPYRGNSSFVSPGLATINLRSNSFAGPISPDLIRVISQVGSSWDLALNRLECPREPIAAAIATWNKTTSVASQTYVSDRKYSIIAGSLSHLCLSQDIDIKLALSAGKYFCSSVPQSSHRSWST